MSRARHAKRNLQGNFAPCMREGGAVPGSGTANAMKFAKGGGGKCPMPMDDGEPMTPRLDRKPSKPRMACGGKVIHKKGV